MLHLPCRARSRLQVTNCPPMRTFVIAYFCHPERRISLPPPLVILAYPCHPSLRSGSPSSVRDASQHSHDRDETCSTPCGQPHPYSFAGKNPVVKKRSGRN